MSRRLSLKHHFYFLKMVLKIPKMFRQSIPFPKLPTTGCRADHSNFDPPTYLWHRLTDQAHILGYDSMKNQVSFGV